MSASTSETINVGNVLDKTLILQNLRIGNGRFLQNLEFNFSPMADHIEVRFHWLPFCVVAQKLFCMVF